MGLPLSPTFANLFLSYYEKIWINDCPHEFKPTFYTRYVDDTFVLFRDPSHVTLFLDYLNTKHQNIKFTSEVELNTRISFLDCSITRVDSSFCSSVYRKKTFTGQGLSFFSHCCYQFKINSISTLLHRAYSVSSNFTNLNIEFSFLVGFF